MLSNDTSVGEKKNKKRSLNSQEYRLSENGRMKKLSGLTKKKQTSSSSSALPPTAQVIREESASKKMREDKTFEATQLRKLIMNARARIDELSTQITENPHATNLEELKKERSEQQDTLKEQKEDLAALENELKELSEPVPEPCRFFVS